MGLLKGYLFVFLPYLYFSLLDVRGSFACPAMAADAAPMSRKSLPVRKPPPPQGP